MELNIKQKNELVTGIVLAQELDAITENTKRFMVVRSFDISDGRVKPWSKTLPNTLDNIKAKFIVKVYSINIEYLDLDVDERDCSDYVCFEDIYSFDELYRVIEKYVDDFSGLIPQWNVRNPIE